LEEELLELEELDEDLQLLEEEEEPKGSPCQAPIFCPAVCHAPIFMFYGLQ
jgi:hypothetical protein